MADITIQKKTQNNYGWEYTVRIQDDDESQTEHLVTVPLMTAQRLTGSKDDPDNLVIKSFQFLLEHELKESIMPKFEIEVISQYFPDWEKKMLT